MKIIVSSKGQVVLPAEWRQMDGLRTEERFEIERVEAGQYLLKRQDAAVNEEVVDWLLSCPEKDWFAPIRQESTDTL